MAIAFDSVNPDSASGAGVTSLTATAQTIAGSDRVALGFTGTGDSAHTTHTSFKVGGSGGTSMGAAISSVTIGTHGRLSAYALVAPATGSQAAYGDWGASQGEATIAMLTYTGVDQVTPISGLVTASGATSGGGTAAASVTVTGTTAGDTCVACAFLHNTSGASGPLAAPGSSPAMTGRYETEGAQIGSFAAMQVIEYIATGSSTPMTVDFSSADLSLADAWTIVAFKLNAAGAAPPPPNMTINNRGLRPRAFAPGSAR